MTKITLSGVLANMRLAQANIKVNLGDQEFTGHADADSKYAIELQVESNNLQQPI